MNKYTIYYESGNQSKGMAIHAMSAEDAMEVFRRNFGPHPEAEIKLVRPTTAWELEQINNTGGPCPHKRNV